MRDAQGRRIYAAFTQVHLREARLHAVQEDDRLQWQLRGTRVGRSQHYSRQLLRGPQGAVAQLEMLSVFVARERAGDNTSVVRVPMAQVAAAPHAGCDSDAVACAEAARAVRAGAWRERIALAWDTPPLALDMAGA